MALLNQFIRPTRLTLRGHDNHGQIMQFAKKKKERSKNDNGRASM
jgi:hypothetical protein